MLDRALDFLLDTDSPARPVHAVRPEDLAALLGRLPAARFVTETGFAAGLGEIAWLPGPDGLEGAVLGLGSGPALHGFGALPFGLPPNTTWCIEPGGFPVDEAVLGFCLGAYRCPGAPAGRPPARLLLPQAADGAVAAARAVWMARDLINMPANQLGPADLADAAEALACRAGAVAERVEGAALAASYPAVAAVGAGSARPPVVIRIAWQGSTAPSDAPLVSLCGKGVCFDSGGYDLKPSSGMLRMKKDMGGAAVVLGVARLIMEDDLPIRLAVRIGCVENSVSGAAMRPLDVLRTRSGLTVEVGNTDAEGRLVLCDLLAEACEEAPALLIDCATLTGAARVALGPDLPALFCNDDAWAAALLAAGAATHDPLWRLPLWDGYESWLKSPSADLNNVSGETHAGAVTAALFLRRFITSGVSWAHFDVYGWNDQTRPGRPEGGEAHAARAIHSAIVGRFAGAPRDRNGTAM